MDQQSHLVDDSLKAAPKPPVVRGARACTVCRAAKMKCVGAEDGKQPCQRCKRANVDCVFEKHRRGRKPGSKLSEASKMLRRLEKGLNNAKMKSQAAEASLAASFPVSDSRSGPSGDGHYINHPFRTAPASQHFGGPDLPPLQLPYPGSPGSAYSRDHAHRSMDVDNDDEADADGEQNEDGMYPAKMIVKERQRNSFFGTVLGPSTVNTVTTPLAERNAAFPTTAVPPLRPFPPASAAPDPISIGLIDEAGAKVLFDLVFLRLNPFINLFDPELHSVGYVRAKCPFLFACLIMAGCKFWRPELYKQCYKLAHELSVRAFAESWKRVEVVQAFACLMYWKEPDDSRTWTYIGYACRMAVELGLNRYIAHPPEHETELQRLERRNRERTYLVLFVHDRSLSTQTGRQWMLPEDELVRQSHTWHEQVVHGVTIRPEDVVITAFVALRRICAETTDDLFDLHRGSPSGSHSDVNYDVLLRGCNGKLTQWTETWEREMKRASGEPFHLSFLRFFRQYVRIFLNSFGIQASLASGSRASPSLRALSACYTSAMDSLRIVTEEFSRYGVLHYGQDSITVMTAYSAIFLLKLLRNPKTTAELPEGASNEVYALISKVADSYHDAGASTSSLSSAAYHARFLRTLVSKDMEMKARQIEKERRENAAIDPTLQNDQQPTSHSRSSSRFLAPLSSGPVSSNGHTSSTSSTPTTPPVYQYSQSSFSQPQTDHTFHFPASPHVPNHPGPSEQYESPPTNVVRPINGAAGTGGNVYSANQQHAIPQTSGNQEMDAHYWRNMFRELGFGGNVDPTPGREVEYFNPSPDFNYQPHYQPNSS